MTPLCIQTRSAASARKTPPAPALPQSVEIVRRSVVVTISRATSSMALMFSHDASAGRPVASIALRWMPLDQKSGPPASRSTLDGRDFACRIAASSRRHCEVDMAPLWKAKCSTPTSPCSS